MPFLNGSNSESNQTDEENHSVYLPNETWVGVFKFLSRRDLLRTVQPTCRHFNNISECRLVDNVHVIRHLQRFVDGLDHNSPEVIKQYAELLSANDASLGQKVPSMAQHFQLDENLTYYLEQLAHNSHKPQPFTMAKFFKRFAIYYVVFLFRASEKFDRIDLDRSLYVVGMFTDSHLLIGISATIGVFLSEKWLASTSSNDIQQLTQLDVFNRSLYLLRGCRLKLQLFHDVIGMFCSSNPDKLPTYLALLQTTRPFSVEVSFDKKVASCGAELQPDTLLHVPVILNCSRLIFKHYDDENKLSADSICNWLHHLSSDDQQKKEQGGRNKIFKLSPLLMPNTYSEIIECCKKRLRQSESSLDRRAFLLEFRTDTQQMPFHIDHSPTGEVLQLKKINSDNFNGYIYYCLRRCPMADSVTTDQFSDDISSFGTPPVKNGMEAPNLTIHHII